MSSIFNPTQNVGLTRLLNEQITTALNEVFASQDAHPDLRGAKVTDFELIISLNENHRRVGLAYNSGQGKSDVLIRLF